MALQYMYNNTRTRIYSIKAEHDPVVQIYHSLCQVAITLHHSRLFWTVVLLFAKCTNAKMMFFIKLHLELMLDNVKMRKWILGDGQSELTLLEEEGGFKSCTKLGNAKNADRIGDISAFLVFICDSSTSSLNTWMDCVLNGSVECSSVIRKLAKVSKLKCIGQFKRYFAAKVLRNLCHSVTVKPVAGPNLKN